MRRVAGSRRAWSWVAGLLLAYALGGFLLVPIIIKDQLPALARANTGAETSIGTARFNPFFLSAELRDVALAGAEGEIVRIDRLFVNLQASSLIRRAWTFDAIAIEKPYVDLVRFEAGDTNLSRMLARAEAASDTDSRTGKTSDGLPRVIIDDFTLSAGEIHFRDLVPETDFDVVIRPVEIALLNVSTLPDEVGRQRVAVMTESGTNLSWTGSTRIAPLLSTGRITLDGPYLPLLYRYFQDRLAFRLVESEVTATLDYRLEALPDGSLSARLESGDMKLSNMHFRDDAEDIDFLLVDGLALEGISAKWPEQIVEVGSFIVDGIDLDAHIDEEGQLNIARLLTFGDRDTRADVSSTDNEETPAGQDTKIPADDLLEKRYQKFRKLGAITIAAGDN